jgi:hypothetical protein
MYEMQIQILNTLLDQKYRIWKKKKKSKLNE